MASSISSGNTIRGWLKRVPGLRGAAAAYRRRSLNAVFRRRRWGNGESRSGSGSTLAQTELVRAHIAAILDEYQVDIFADIPCGDLNWLRLLLPGIRNYIGGDVVPEIVDEAARSFGGPGRFFVKIDLVKSVPPRADMLLCRDCLVHLSLQQGLRALENIARSGTTWLLATTFPTVQENRDIMPGAWRPLNLERPPFTLGPADRLFNEGCPVAGHEDKSLGLWRLNG